jgi:galactose mutarotase-like enzyme
VAEIVTIGSGSLTAQIDLFGAELQSLITADGAQLMGPGDPAYWAGRAPLLFPIVGRLNGDRYRWQGEPFAMEKHGFARRMLFQLVSADAQSVLLRLTDTPETWQHYPFAFELDAGFALKDETLSMTVTVRNPAETILPFSFGYHPSFAWPLTEHADRQGHVILFEMPEPAKLCAITDNGLIGTERVATPVRGNEIILHDELFVHDALVWNDLQSHSVRYGVPGQRMLDIDFPDTEWLGIWTKPGAAFVCVEPWAGMADPEGFAGDFGEKPGVILLPGGASRSFRMSVRLSR